MKRTTPGDPHKRLLQHMEASRKQREWAEKGLAYAEAGKVKDAKAALKKAEYWELKRRELEG